MKTMKFLLAITLAFVCITSCSSDDDDNGIDITVNKRIKNIQVTDYYTANFSYEEDKVSKITITDNGETLIMSFDYQSNKIIETITNDFYNGNENSTTTYNLENGLVKSPNYVFSSGQLSQVYNELKYSYDKNGSMIASDNYSKITLSKHENKQQMWPLEIYEDNPRNLRYYVGAFGKPTKYLPEKAASNDYGYYISFSYSFDGDGYVKEIKCKDDEGNSWIETYTYETIQ